MEEGWLSEIFETVDAGYKLPPKILSLSGGGYRGLFTASILEKIEERHCCQVGDSFALIAGTSAGALIAAAISSEISAKHIRETFEEFGPAIFPRNVFTTAKQLAIAPYSIKGVQRAMDRLFEKSSICLDAPLSALPIKLLVTAVSFDSHRLRVFAGKDLDGEQSERLTLREALLASAAAPTYFPVLKVPGNESLVDGGLVANAPDLVALVHASTQFALPLEKLFMMSIGTATPNLAAVRQKGFRNGILRAILSRRGIVQITLDSQEALAVELAEKILRKNYLRVDRSPPPNQANAICGMDRTDAQATRTLLELAREAFVDATDRENWRAFF